MDPHNLLILVGISSLWFVGGTLLGYMNRTVKCVECAHCKKAATEKAEKQDETNHQYDHDHGYGCKRPNCALNKDD